ncbi:hypothetical protein GCM10007860_29270 [Chitiniphilus shinanonensis]|uniref:Uncharacterized protein n=1 Tax=Chitiniphilus shinanonensis TaxID=553088 RepID=A0ABQ6BUU9_9NEIS|nr:hypothetical protein [Chitiniphilus shinanonensis]GLS05770.1 hypothetical protein GCM10007860_29270 [Chitiniphilus shinanonensis]
MADDQDREFVRLAEAALDALFDQYAAAGPAERWQLKPAITKATEEMTQARLALFKEGVLTTPEDLDALRQLKRDIDHAADVQAGVLAAVKLAAMLGVFA